MGRAYVEMGSASRIWRRRAIAGIIDHVIAVIFGIVTTWMVDGLFGPSVGTVIGTLAVIGYFAYFEGSRGQPIGKLVAGVAVVSTTGQPCGFRRSLVRNVVRIVDFLPFAYLLGIVVMSQSDRSQRLGDHAAGTVVGRVRRDS